MTDQEIIRQVQISWMMINEHRDADLIAELWDVVRRVSEKVNERHFRIKLLSDEWPQAVDPLQICKTDSEDDKNVRASAIFSLIVATHLYDGRKPAKDKRILDFGCGEGHLVKQIEAGKVDLTIGYDIRDSGWERWSASDRRLLTTDLDVVKLRGPYDLIVMYDVLDHAEGSHPTDLLRIARACLSPGGKLVVRMHPWISRHGTHLWSLNKAYAHLIFTESQLAEMGYVGLPTIRVTNPDAEYVQWFRDAGLRITWERQTNQQAGPIFENNPSLKSIVSSYYNHGNIPYNLIEQVWRDFCLEV